MPTRPTTPAQKADAARLDRLFTRWVDDLEEAGQRSTQEDIAESLGCTQSTLSQRLKVKMAINATFAANIAKLLGVSVRDFSPDLADQIDRLADGNRPTIQAGQRLQAKEKDPQWSRRAFSVADAVDTLREALAANLAGWARSGGTEPWRGVVKGLLAAGAATTSPAQRVGNGHRPRARTSQGEFCTLTFINTSTRWGITRSQGVPM